MGHRSLWSNLVWETQRYRRDTHYLQTKSVQKHLHLGLLPSNVLQSDQYTNYLLKVVETRHSFLLFDEWSEHTKHSLCVCVCASAQRLSGRSVFNARQIYGTQILCDYHRNSWNIGIWGHYQETRGLQQKQNTEQSLLCGRTCTF